MLEPQLEKPVATDSVALTDNNFVCALSSFRRRQAIQLPICRAWWTSFIQPSTVSPCLPVPQVFLCPRCLFPFVSYGKYFHAKFHGFLFGNGTRNLIASSWRNKTLRKRRMMKAARKKDPMYSCILFHFLLHILSSLKYTYSECKSLSKLLIHSHPPKSHANLIKKKKERESTQKTSPLSPFSGTQSIIRSRGSFRPRSSTSCTAKVKKKKRNSSEIPKERIGNSFLLHIPHPRHLATNLSLSSPSHSSLHLSTDSRFTDDRRTALQKVGTCSLC